MDGFHAHALTASIALMAALAAGVTTKTEAAPAAGGKAAGENLFKTVAPPCSSCHSLQPGVVQLGPSLAGIASRAARQVKAPDYKGKAKDARGYIRESIVEPNAYLVPGKNFSTGGSSMMPNTFATTLKPAQIDQLVDYLMTLK